MLDDFFKLISGREELQLQQDGKAEVVARIRQKLTEKGVKASLELEGSIKTYLWNIVECRHILALTRGYCRGDAEILKWLDGEEGKFRILFNLGVERLYSSIVEGIWDRHSAMEMGRRIIMKHGRKLQFR